MRVSTSTTQLGELARILSVEIGTLEQAHAYALRISKWTDSTFAKDYAMAAQELREQMSVRASETFDSSFL